MEVDYNCFNFSIRLLGSRETHDTLVADMYDLVDRASEEDLTPIFVRLGPLFLDIGICSSLRLEQDISDDDWGDYVDKYRNEISVAHRAFKQELIRKIETSTNGRDERFFSNLPSKMKFFYDPDETYISLVTCSKEFAKPGERSTKSGHLVITLKLKPEEILLSHYQLIKNQ